MGGGCADSLWDLSSQPETEFRPLQWKHRVLTIRLPGNSWVPKFSNLVFIIFIWQFQHLHFLLPVVSTFSHLLCFVYLCLFICGSELIIFLGLFFFMRVVNISEQDILVTIGWFVILNSQGYSPQGSWHSPLNLIHQRANRRRKKNYNPTDSRMKTIITEN